MSQLSFLYTQAELQNIAESIIQKSLQLGASSVQLEVSESISTDIEILNQGIENFETSHENQLLLTLFKGRKKGNIGVSNLEPDDITTIINQALDIARYTEEDQANGLLEPEYLECRIFETDLELYCPYPIANDGLVQEARSIEELALKSHPQITASDGASISLTQYNFVTANSNGFNRGYQTSRYSNYVSLIGETGYGMQTDYWYSSARNFAGLLAKEDLAKTAAARVARRLNPGKFNADSTKVILESSIAKTIIGNLLGALNGNSLYRKLSFLNDSLGKQALPAWLDIIEDPFIVGGLASCYFDNEGSAVTKRHIIREGKIAAYLLSSYSARRLGMKPTGNAGGTHNISVTSNFSGNLADLAQEMYNGIIIIETIGQGSNMVTGDYSVGASGLVVRNGAIGHFVDNLTISGNMKDIFNNISLIANDCERGSLQCGSMLINEGVIRVSSK